MRDDLLDLKQQKLSGRNTILIIIILFSCTVLVRLFLTSSVLNKPADPLLINTNGEVAKNIIEGRGLVINASTLEMISQQEAKEKRLINPEEVNSVIHTTKSNLSYEPFYDNEIGYPLFLALVWKITGTKLYIYPIVIQIFLAGMAVICVFQIARDFMPIKFAVLSGILYAFYIPEAQLNVLPFQYAWIGLIAVFSTWLVVRIRDNPRDKFVYWRVILLGLLYGIGALMRSTLILLPLVAIISFLYSFKFKQVLKLSVIMVTCFVLVVVPYSIYNTKNFGEQRVIRRTFWHSVATGLAQFPNPWEILPSDESVADWVSKNDPQLLQPVYPNARSEEFLKTKIKTAVINNPSWYLGSIIERVTLAISPFRYVMTQGLIQVKYQNSERIFYRVPHSNNKIFLAFVLSVWITIALMGMYLMRKNWVSILPLVGIWLYFISIHSAIFVQPYYIYPVGFVYAIFSSYTLYKIIEKFYSNKHNIIK